MMPPALIVAALCLAWTVFAFGGVYPWVFVPAMVGCVVVALLGAIRSAPHAANGFRVVLPFVAVLIAAASVQLVPLPVGLLTFLNPGRGFLDAANAVGASAGARPATLVPGQTALLIGWWVLLAAFVWGITRTADLRQLWRLAGVVLLLGVLLGLLGLAQGNNPLIYGVWQPLGVAQPMGPFVNRNHFSGWLLLAMGLGLGFFFRRLEEQDRPWVGGWRGWLLSMGSREGSQMLLVAFALLVMAVAVATSLSRSGLLSGVVLVLVALVFVVMRRRGAHVAGLRGGYAAVVTVLLLGLLWAGAGLVATRFSSGEAAFAARLGVWRDALRIAGDFPGTGTGLGSFGFVLPRYRGVAGGDGYLDAHNDYVQLLVEGGLLVSLPLLLVLARGGVEMVRRLRRASTAGDYWLRAGAMSGLAALTVQEVVEFGLRSPAVALLAATCAALALHGAREDW